ncbi:MAG: glycosyltransferase family 1 protein [Candidatus Peregrinibacteria bacterium]|nr:glycosyltransferase family 1 protein [Candidatus Peregrinibacteria bacterium]
MKIAIDIRSAAGEKAGKGWFTFNIVRNLLKIDRKNEYTLYCSDFVAGFEEFKNAKQKRIRGKGILWHINTVVDAYKEKTDAFISPTSFIVPILLPKRIKSIIVVHDLVAFLFPKTHNKKAVFIEKLLLKTALKKAYKVITVSKNTKKDVIEKFGTDEGKIEVITCAAGEEYGKVGEEILKEFAKKTNLPEKFFLAVGTIEPRKNYVNLIKAFSLIKDRFPDYYLIIVGKNGWKFEPVYEEIRKNYLQKYVHILGYLSEKSLVNLYNLAEALIFPSFYEGFGIPPLEAMKSLCPVISSCTSSLPEVVGDSALLVDPESPSQIAEAMVKIIMDEALKTTLKEKGLNQSAKFSWESSADKFYEILHKMPKR